MLFFLYALLFTWAIVLSRAAASGSLSTSSTALAYFLLHLLVLGGAHARAEWKPDDGGIASLWMCLLCVDVLAAVLKF
jgi:hypothetical protein